MIANQNPNIAKIVLMLLITIMSPGVEAGEPEVYYYASNDRSALETEAIKKVEVNRVSDKKIWLLTYMRSNGGWEMVQKEKIQVKSSDQHTICHYDGRRISYKTNRIFSKNGQSGYQFVDRKDGTIIKSGHSKNKVPLHLQGEITEYYDTGEKKSLSMFIDNQLIWNHNWLRNGEKFVDTIFYSVDTWPEYLNGSTALKPI